MSIEDILLQQVRQNVDRAKRTKETSMEYAPSPGQMSNFAGMLAPGAGYLDAVGEYPALPSYDQPVTEAFSNEPYPSFAENLQRGGFGGYFDASMQGLGMAGDTLYAAPFVGPPLGGMLKGLGAFGAVMRAGSKAGKGAKTEEGIATLGKQPMFTPEDTLNLAYTPDGSFSPGIKDLIEKASPKLRGQGITQWANKNLKPKELEVLGIDEFIKANPKATLKETVEGISGNKVVVGKKVLGGGEGQKMDFDITEPTDDPLTGAVLWDDIIGDTVYGLDDGDQYIQEDLVNHFNTLRAEKFVETGSEKGIPDKIYEFDEITGDKLEQLGLGKGSSMALDDLIESYSESVYMSNPYELIRPTGVNVGDNTFAFGNEDTGYSLFVDGRRMEGYDVPYSQTEAQIQLRDVMADQGYDMFRVNADDFDPDFDGFGGETRYKQYIDDNLPGGKNYREIIYTYEGADETHNLAHSAFNPEEGNYLAHALVRDRKLADGTETLHGDEIQSDLHSRGFKEGYNLPDKVKIEEINKIESFLEGTGLTMKPPESLQIDELVDNVIFVRDGNDFLGSFNLRDLEYLSKYAKEQGRTRYGSDQADAIVKILGKEKVSELADLAKPLADQGTVPNYPYKDDYHEIVLKKMLLQAVEEGKPAISVSSSAPMVDRYSDSYEEFYKILYDQDIPKSMRNLAKKYGGEFEVGSLDIDNTFGSGTEKFLAAPETGLDRRRNLVKSNIIRITEEMRNKILLEGIPDFAIGGIVNKGIATLKTAKQPTEGIVDLGLY